ncbi:MAG TPA: indolepyruvate ferredoxin oxidoreductase family protein [Steroidobacteraceae bacterium]
MSAEAQKRVDPASGVSLDDKYALNSGRALLSGTQALVRLPLMQRARDLAVGLNTAGFITGYRGSPLGGYDIQLHAESKRLADSQVSFQPGLNEDLAATAVWGTQQANLLPHPKFDGVFSIWYGKGPGVDRSGDPIKHANRMGTSKHGGVLLVFGDDHAGKSSTVSHQSEQALAANGVPVLYPASVQEYLDLGLHGFALSRAAGVWVGLKCVNETVETTSTVELDPHRITISPIGDAELPAEGVSARFVFDPLRDEVRLRRFKLPLAHAYARANRLDRVTHEAPQRILGIVAAGKSWIDVLSALAVLELDETRARRLGIRIYKPAMIWPLEPASLRDFARDHQELFFIEEKAAFMEAQAAHILYNLDHASRPRIVGKFDQAGGFLLPADMPLDPLDIALKIGERLRAVGSLDEPLRKRIELLEHSVTDMGLREASPISRSPYFCSGCPHNTSTKVPDGSIALAGIGCHTMAMGMNRSTLPPTQMGGEGVNWVGIAPFSGTPHVFQNLGDGTYVHSGLLALRASMVAGVNITYKILVNDAVAMTGGQTVEGHFSVAEITHQLRAERIARIAVVSDDVHKYGAEPGFAPGVTVHDRAELDALQRELRAVQGVSALIYDQTCAAEKRRRGKRRPPEASERRIFINDRVCEGCGDCSVQSNCVSVEPKETAFGRKRQINQSSCNKDYSCLNGFCPSFVVVEGTGLRKPAAPVLPGDQLEVIPEPQAERAQIAASILITGIGGTGVVTVGAVLAMAAHLEGLSASVYDMTGLAQKGGAVLSHLRIAECDASIAAVRIGKLAADVIIGCDLVVTASEEALRAVDPNRTRVLINTHMVPTSAFQNNPDIDFHREEILKHIERRVGHSRTAAVDATEAAVVLMGDSIGTNMFMVGFALQRGLLPLRLSSVTRAIELNGVAVEFNLRALALGRLTAHDEARFSQLLAACPQFEKEPPAETLADVVARYEAELIAYQDESYARRYRDLVERVSQVERDRIPGDTPLSKAVAQYYFKLLAYKDEYEVARLHSSARFHAQLDATFAPGYRVKHQLAPPMFARKDPRTGVPRKMQFGPWMSRVFVFLAKLKFLRGSPFDPFGYTSERRMERRLITDYEVHMEQLLRGLEFSNRELAIRIASLPEQIRGYGHIKRHHVEAVEAYARELMAQWSVAASKLRLAA